MEWWGSSRARKGELEEKAGRKISGKLEKKMYGLHAEPLLGRTKEFCSRKINGFIDGNGSNKKTFDNTELDASQIPNRNFLKLIYRFAIYTMCKLISQ